MRLVPICKRRVTTSGSPYCGREDPLPYDRILMHIVGAEDPPALYNQQLLIQFVNYIIMANIYEIFVHVPESHAEQVKEAMFASGAGHTGNYSHVSWQTKGEGQFLAEEGSRPRLGKIGALERVAEYRIHTICTKNKLKQIITALKAAHPYEMPAYGVVKLENW